MKLRDLGALDAPVLLFGGPYSNLAATRALLAEARTRSIAPDHMICTGDVVAYCANTSQTVAAIRASGCAVVAGNCEIQLAHRADHCGCGFEAGTQCDLLSVNWYAHADARISAEDRDWMGSLPDIISFTHHGQRFAVIHGGVRDVSRFVWEVSSEQVFEEEIKEIQNLVPGTTCVIAGHSGLPFRRRVGKADWINAGVIGMPPHDGCPCTRFAVLEKGKVAFHELVYDHRAEHEAMRLAGLSLGYDQSLLSGFWPSEDILPEALRARG